MANASVLIGFGDALAAPEVAMSLLGSGHRVTSFVRHDQRVALSRVPGVELVPVTAPEDDLAACLQDVAALAARHDVTMPLNDIAVLVCDRAADPTAPVAGPRGDRARLALDKRLQLTSAEAAGLAVPEWIETRPGDPVPEGWPAPLVMKPAMAVEEAGAGTRRLSPRLVSTRADMDAAWGRWGESTPVILQRWVHGFGAGVFGLAGPEGVHHLSAHRRVRMMNPAGSGSSACASAPVPDQLVGAVDRFMSQAGWQGMFMIELLRSGSTDWFMELNGRAWGSLALSRRLGFEYPAWAVARALDPSAPLPEAPPFRDMLCRNLGRELIHLSFILRGPRPGQERWPSRRATVRALLRQPRGTTWYNLAPGQRRLFLYDAWRTVADQTWAKAR
ncbi:MAG: hypothetical protein ACXVFO_13045 [Solirubrobacteraceae bacterium]